MYMKNLMLNILFCVLFSACSSSDFVFRNQTDLSVSMSPDEAQVVQTALNIFAKDYQQVFGGEVFQDEHRNPR